MKYLYTLLACIIVVIVRSQAPSFACNDFVSIFLAFLLIGYQLTKII